MDLYYLILFLLCVAGTAAVMTQTHMHGMTQFGVYAAMIIVTGAVGMVAFMGGGMPHWALFLAKMLVVCGACFGSYLAAHHFQHHHRPVMAFLSWVVGILLAIGILFYDPARGIGSPLDGIVDMTTPPAPVASDEEDEEDEAEDTGDGEEEPEEVIPPVVQPRSSPAPRPAPTSREIKSIPAEELPCSIRPVNPC